METQKKVWTANPLNDLVVAFGVEEPAYTEPNGLVAGHFTVNVNSGVVTSCPCDDVDFVIPKDYKSIILTLLPAVTSAQRTAQLLPKLKIDPNPSPYFQKAL